MWICHIYGWVVAPIGKMRHTTLYEYVTSPIYMVIVTCMIESCHPCACGMSHVWTGHVTHTNDPCHMYRWVMSPTWESHITHMNESCHPYEGVMAPIWMSHVTHMKESCHPYEWVMSRVWRSHVTGKHTPWETCVRRGRGGFITMGHQNKTMFSCIKFWTGHTVTHTPKQMYTPKHENTHTHTHTNAPTHKQTHPNTRKTHTRTYTH